MPVTVLTQVLHGLIKSHMTASAMLDPVQNLFHARPLSEPAKLSGHELLQRLAAALGAPLQGSVHVVRKIANEQVRHAYIMQACPAPGKRASHTSHGRTTAVLRTQVLAYAADGADNHAGPHLRASLRWQYRYRRSWRVRSAPPAPGR
jgi:hypothetical protein